MARPIEFDRTRALQSAMLLFWRQGYSATSLAQLLDEMAISRSSFYAAFSDKHSIFAEALELFGDRTADRLRQISEEHGAIDAARVFFESTLFDVPTKRLRQGCMMVNSLLELADVEPDLSQLAADKLAQIEQIFEDNFSKAIESGEIKSKRSAKQIAQFVMTLNQGLRVTSRKNIPKIELAELVDSSIDMLRAATR